MDNQQCARRLSARHIQAAESTAERWTGIQGRCHEVTRSPIISKPGRTQEQTSDQMIRLPLSHRRVCSSMEFWSFHYVLCANWDRKRIQNKSLCGWMMSFLHDIILATENRMVATIFIYIILLVFLYFLFFHRSACLFCLQGSWPRWLVGSVGIQLRKK